MDPVWHPLSTILLAEPPCYAATKLVRMLLAAEPRLRLVYAGDRMYPAVAHGSTFVVERLGDGPILPGRVVLVSRDGIPDLLRVASVRDDGIDLAADADPQTAFTVTRADVLGTGVLPTRRSSASRARFRRIALDLREAWHGRAESTPDASDTVREKYEAQAAHYARDGGPELEPRLLERIRGRVAAGQPLVVVGSGAGSESLALVRAGYRVSGVDFSPTMVDLARRAAERRGIDVRFDLADVRTWTPPDLPVGAVIFTYAVYSFLPDRSARIAFLRRVRTWLGTGGTVFLSARLARSAYERALLGIQWLARARSSATEWGDSHTRWIPGDGTLRRSFVHVFSPRALRLEAGRAGLRIEDWEGGHGTLSPHPTARATIGGRLL